MTYSALDEKVVTGSYAILLPGSGHREDPLLKEIPSEIVSLLKPVELVPTSAPLKRSTDSVGEPVGRFVRADTAFFRKAVNALRFSRPITKDRYIPLEYFEGEVLNITDDSFWARLNSTMHDTPASDIEILKEELDPQERSYLKCGAAFSLSIGYRTQNSTRFRLSVIHFRRAPEISREEQFNAYEIGTDLLNCLRSPDESHDESSSLR